MGYITDGLEPYIDRWEYRTFNFEADKFYDEMNRIGDEGWEAYFIHQHIGSGFIVYVKRKKFEKSESTTREPSREASIMGVLLDNIGAMCADEDLSLLELRAAIRESIRFAEQALGHKD